MKQISLFIPLLGTLLLSGCAGTSTEFECNATTSDTCMTMEQANEKAKKTGAVLRSKAGCGITAAPG
ncbi:protein traV [Escherichia coli DEC8D]|nr:protein traV [Escherichia coli DEC8D]